MATATAGRVSKEEVVARAQRVEHLRGCPVDGTDDPEVASRVEEYVVIPPRMNENARDDKAITTVATHCMECGAMSYGER